jgi:hypothetical protein
MAETAMDVQSFGITQDLVAGSTRDGEQITQPVRLGARGEQFTLNLWNGMQASAIEGSYWIASTATPGTGITLSVATGTTFSDTQALLCINNTDSANQNGRILTLDFITIVVTTAPTSATAMFLAHRIDSQTRGTAGTRLGANSTSPKPVNMNIGGASAGECFALGGSAVSVAASGNVRNVGRNILRGQIPVVGDHLTVKFGSAEMAAGGVNVAATTASGITVFAPPVSIGPQQSYVCNEWSTARSAALSGEIIVGWVER